MGVDAMYRIGIDVGGTFTDLVAIDGQGMATLAKVPSTPADPSLGVIDGLAALAAKLGLDRAALLAQTDRIVHGTTVATNALLELKGARTGLLTTEGHRDVIEMREGLKPERYNLRMTPPAPLVPRHLRLAVRERMKPDGSVETALDPASLEAAVAALAEAEVQAVAVCFLHSWRNPVHEQAAADAVMAEVGALGGAGGVIVLTPRGEAVFSFTTPGMYRGEASPAGHRTALYREEDQASTLSK